MFLCRGARLSAAALDQALKSSSGLLHVHVKADRLGHVTRTLRNNNALRRSRASFCVSTDSKGGKREGDFATVDWDSPTSSRFIILDSGYFGRAATLDLSKSQQSVNGNTFCNSRANTCQSRQVGTFESVLFTGGGEVCTPRWFLTAMQTRASSTAAAAQKRATDAGETSTDNKGEEQSLKEPSLSSPKAPGEPEPEEGKLNKTQQLKKVFKEYGAVGVSFHVTISLMSLGMFYLLVSSGIDMAEVLCKVGFSESVVQSKMAAGTSTFVLAYAVHKLFAPVRMSITLVSVPLIVRYFRKTGLFKPPTPAP